MTHDVAMSLRKGDRLRSPFEDWIVERQGDGVVHFSRDDCANEWNPATMTHAEITDLLRIGGYILRFDGT